VKTERSEVSVIEQLRNISRVRIVDGGNIPFPLVRRKRARLVERLILIDDSDEQLLHPQEPNRPSAREK